MNQPLRLPIFLVGLVWCLSFGYPLDAQILAFNRSTQQTATKVQSNSRTLRDALMQLKKQYGIDILFEEKILEGIMVSNSQIVGNATLENRLTKLLQPVGLRFKKGTQVTRVEMKFNE